MGNSGKTLWAAILCVGLPHQRTTRSFSGIRYLPGYRALSGHIGPRARSPCDFSRRVEGGFIERGLKEKFYGSTQSSSSKRLPRGAPLEVLQDVSRCLLFELPQGMAGTIQAPSAIYLDILAWALFRLYRYNGFYGFYRRRR